MLDVLKILVIEDDDDTRESLKDILELDHHQVTTFSTAEAAMQNGMAEVDVVLMDRRLPDGFAEDILPRIKDRARDADFIIITGYADMQAAIAALREGVADYLIKPIDPDSLRAALARLAKRRTVERELYRQRRFAEKLLETAEAIILVLDAKGRILRVNPYLLELTGYSLDKVVGADWFDRFIPERDRARIRHVFEQAAIHKKTRGIVNPILTADGRECDIRWSNSTLRTKSGETAAVLCIGLDVTDYVKAQKQVLQNERLAAIGQTMAGLAHESRNALQRLQSSVDLLQEELAGQTEALGDLAKIERAGDHIRSLLEQVRNYAAPINLVITREPLPRIWHRAWRSLAHRHEGRHVVLKEPGLTSNDIDELCIPLDAQRIEQVFRNLFENALDAQGDQLVITITISRYPDTIELTLHDNGPGVPDGYQVRLFDAFATTKPTGTGLGLAICRRAVEAHGGRLSLVPCASGAAFRIELPVRR